MRSCWWWILGVLLGIVGLVSLALAQEQERLLILTWAYPDAATVGVTAFAVEACTRTLTGDCPMAPVQLLLPDRRQTLVIVPAKPAVKCFQIRARDAAQFGEASAPVCS